MFVVLEHCTDEVAGPTELHGRRKENKSESQDLDSSGKTCCRSATEKPCTVTVHIFMHSCNLGRIEDICLVIRIPGSLRSAIF